MDERVFLAGASGVVGRRLVPLLLRDGWRVWGMTRSAARAARLTREGAEPVVVDVYDADALYAALTRLRPRLVIHQLTDLPAGLDPARRDEAIVRNARIRDEGTRILIAAATAAGVERLIAQSIAFAYADGPEPHREDDALAVDAEGARGVSARGAASLERQVLEAPLAGVVLRYGRFYGPGTGIAVPVRRGPVHVDAAARAAVLATTRGAPGLYNIAEDDGAVSSEKAKALLGWDAAWRP